MVDGLPWRGTLLATALLGAVTCDKGDPAPAPAAPAAPSPTAPPTPAGADDDDPLAPLRAFEDNARAGTDFSAVVPWSTRAGPDPFALLRRGGDTLAILRGASTLTTVDEDGRIGALQLATPPRPTALVADARRGPPAVWIAGEGSGRIAHATKPNGRTWTIDFEAEVPGVAAIRAVADDGAGRLVLADRHRGWVRSIPAPRRGGPTAPPVDLHRCRGALSVDVVAEHVIANCMLDHAVVVTPLRPGVPPLRIEHDGPMWSVAAVAAPDGGLLLAIGGVEDHALDRSDGSFGFIDSFAWLYRVDAQVEQRVAQNVSELGVVTPKAIALRPTPEGFDIVVTGYGADALVEIPVDRRGARAGDMTMRPLVPGLTSVLGDARHGTGTSALLDAIVQWDRGGVHVLPVGRDDPRSVEVRVGEALVFTTLMAPWNPAQGRASRFTCETCHFEGTVDGRTHFTGREHVHATTKTLRGLFENRPHFTRALDRTMTQMVHNEFRVANKASGRDPWFSLSPTDAPWLSHLGRTRKLDPVDLRRSLMAFLMTMAHEPNPATHGRTAFTTQERTGAALFAEHCESCHRAALVTDDPATRVEPQAWEAAIFSGGRPVWASADRVRAGVTPYVHDEGARPPSLRRLWTKHPYFTNGSADDLDHVLRGIVLGEGPAADVHGDPDAPGVRRLGVQERAAMAAFLDTL